MTFHWMRTGWRISARGLAWLAAGVAWVGGTSHGQTSPETLAARGPFPTLPVEHVHARALLEGSLRYLNPAHKLVDPVSGYPFEGWNQDPPRGMFLRSFTQITAIGLYMEAVANVAAGRADSPHLSRDQALTRLAHLVKTLRADQQDPTLSAEGLLSNFLDLGTDRRLGPLASHVQKAKILEAFGLTRGEALWKALAEFGWIAPSVDGQEADVTRKQEYGDQHFKGPLAPYNDPETRRKLLTILDARVVMVIFGDNSNLTTSAAKTVGTLLEPSIKDQPGVAAIRDQLEQFLEAQRPGYNRLYDREGGLFFFGWDVTRNRLFGWDDLQGKRVTGHMDYMVNEFRGPATFIATRFGLPTDAIANLGFKIKVYRSGNDRPWFVPAPWEGSAFQGLGLGLSLGEAKRTGWREVLQNMVAIELDFANRHGLPGFLSESYTGDGTQYTGSVGIPEITVSPKPRITNAASLYTLGVAYSVAPESLEAFLARNAATIETLLTDHGPWEGFNVTRKTPIAFQTTAHTLALTLGLIGQGSADLARYLDARGLTNQLDAFFQVGPEADLMAESSPPFAWSAKGETLQSSARSGGFRVHGDALNQVGIAFVHPDPKGWNLSGGILTLRYRSRTPVDPISIEFKPGSAPPGLISRQILTRLPASQGGREGDIRVPLPATPGLVGIKEVVLYHEQADKAPVDLTITHISIRPPAR